MIKITEQEFRQFSRYIKSNYGINLKNKKQKLLTGRLQNVLIEHGFSNFTDYYKCIQSDKTGKAISTLLDKITTNHTFFMREAEHFYYFRDYVLAYLTKVVRDKDLRIWSAGCSSGEEPYTLAMIMDEFFGKEKVLWDTQILATDISNAVIIKALQAIYPSNAIEELPAIWKFKYFQKIDDNKLQIRENIKKDVIFRKYNLMEERFPFKRKFHTIFCRNVMIYFDKKTKYELVNKFYEHMEYGGYLFVGHSESLISGETKFQYIMPAVYRKI